MNKQQYEVEKAKLSAEGKEIKQLKAIYGKATEDISRKIRIHNSKIDFLLKNYDQLNDADKSILQSQIYQRQFQENLKKQIDSFMKELEGGQYESISGYLKGCYETGYIGTMYDLAGQGIPLTMPIDQKKVTRAMIHNTKLSTTLYKKLGEDVSRLKRTIASEISRGIATASSYSDIARNIANHSNAGFNRAMRIARTEGHRIQMEAAFDAQHEAQDAGADIVKQWNSALDGRTRPTHRKLDGQIRELDDPFEVEGIKVMYPSGFGKASEDINCRCTMLQRAKWALDEEELEILKKRAAKHGLIVKESQGKALSKEFGHVKAKDFADYKTRFIIAEQEHHMRNKRHNFPKGFKDTRNLGELISENELKAFMKTAEEKGVRIGHEGAPSGNFDLYRGDVKILYEILDETEKQLKIHNIDDIILVYDDVLGYRGDKSKIDIDCFAMTKGKTITLNRFMFDDSEFLKNAYKEAVKERFFVKDSSYVNIITHEIGHIIQKQRRKSIKRIVAILEKEARGKNVSLDKYIVGNISIYAAEKYEETGLYIELISEINVLSVCNAESGIIKLLKEEGAWK